MKLPEIEMCPSCGREIPPTAEKREYFVAECAACGFYASTKDMVQAEFLANFLPLPSVSEVARRIAAREPLDYAASKLANRR